MFGQNTLRLGRRRLSFNQKREIHIMSKKLVAYFSVSGVTEKVAKELAKVENADLFAITPVQPYTKEDLDYTNPNSRSSVEMKDLNCRPELSAKLSETGYDTVFVGFPIWWGREPSAVDTFLTENDFTGAKIIPFCTSGGSPIGSTCKRIAELTGAETETGLRMGGDISEEELKVWTAGLDL